MFPNFSMLRSTSRTFRVWQPRGPDKTEVWSWVYTDKAAPLPVRQQTHKELSEIVKAIIDRKPKLAEKLTSDHLMRMLATINIWQ